MECHTPPHVEGFVHLEFTLNGELTSNPSKTPWKESYMYVASGSVKNIFSFYGYGGSVIEVRGEDFKPGYACRIGANPVPTHFVSSTLLRCEVPGHVEESVTVDVSNAAGTFGTFSDIEFQYTPKAVISQVSPRMGNSQGGTVLSVNGRNFASTNMLKCRVGTIEMNGVWKSSTDVECVTPAAQPGPVNSTIGRLVQISTNQKDFTTGEMKFMHQPLSGVDAAFPSSLPAAGGAPVAVHLPLAHPSEDPKCRFGITVMPGVLEAHLGTVACVSPYSQPGFVAVHVARNGADFEYLPPGVVDGNGVIVEMKVAMEVIVVFPEVGFKGGGGVVEVTGRPHLVRRRPVRVRDRQHDRTRRVVRVHILRGPRARRGRRDVGARVRGVGRDGAARASKLLIRRDPGRVLDQARERVLTRREHGDRAWGALQRDSRHRVQVRLDRAGRRGVDRGRRACGATPRRTPRRSFPLTSVCETITPFAAAQRQT